jgi:hypothetical protein
MFMGLFALLDWDPDCEPRYGSRNTIESGSTALKETVGWEIRIMETT